MRFLALLSAVALALAPLAAQADDADAIRTLMMASFDKPGAPLTVEPITIQDDIAIAGWTQGETGGRALLRREATGWEISLCAGDALVRPDGLAQLGLPPEQARALASAVAAREAALDPAIVAKFALFEGVVVMDAHAP